MYEFVLVLFFAVFFFKGKYTRVLTFENFFTHVDY